MVPDRAFGLEILRVIHGSQEGVQQTEHAGELRRVFLPLVVELVVVVVEVEEHHDLGQVLPAVVRWLRVGGLAAMRSAQ